MNTVLCDQCQTNEVTKANRHHLFVRITSHRVNTTRCWCFCSDACRDAWWEEATDEDFLPVTTRADLQPAITLPAGSDLYVYVGGAKGGAHPQTLTVTMTSATEFDVSSSTLGALGSGLFETIETENPDDPANPFTETKAEFTPSNDGAPFLMMRVGDVALVQGDVITIDYKGNQAPALFDDPALPDDADPTVVDRDLAVDVFRQTKVGPTECVEAVVQKRPSNANDWWKVPPVPEEGGPIRARTPVPSIGPKYQ